MSHHSPLINPTSDQNDIHDDWADPKRLSPLTAIVVIGGLCGAGWWVVAAFFKLTTGN